MLHRSFKPAKCKTALKLAVSRIKLMKNKMAVHQVQLRKEVAQLLASGNERTARIRVEHVVREEKTMAAYDLLEVYCELIVARLAMIESQKNCPIDLKEAVTSVIFASQRCADLPELQDIRKHLQSKYGKEFSTAAVELRPGCGVSRLMIEKLSVAAPDAQAKTKLLSAIALEHSIDWDPKTSGENEEKPPEDLLNGPNTFLRASQQYEPPVQAPTDTQKHDANLHAKTSSPPNSKIFDSSAAPSTSQSQQGAPSVRAEAVEHRYTYSGDHKTFAAGKQNWNMEFTDATSAAHAAAEAAERASMAARAAVELSSGERVVRKQSSESQTQRFSVNDMRNASIDKHSVSTKSDANVTKDHANKFEHEGDSWMETDKLSMKNSRMSNPQPDTAYQNQGLGIFSGKSQISQNPVFRNDEKGENIKLDSSPGSDYFGTESANISRDNVKLQGTNKNEQRTHAGVNEHSNQPVHVRGTSQSDSLKSKASFHGDDIFHNSYREENIFSHSGQAVERENNVAGKGSSDTCSSNYKSSDDENHNFFADEILHEESNIGSSRTHSLRLEDDHDDDFMDKINDSEHGKFQEYSETTVFDNSGSDDDVGKIDFTSGFNDDDPDPFRSLDQRSPKRSSWFVGETSYDELVSKPVFATDESSTSKLFHDQSDNMGSPRSHDSLPVAFDHSDSEADLDGPDHVVQSTQDSLSRHTDYGAGSSNCECVTPISMIDEDEPQHHVSGHSAFNHKQSKSTRDPLYTRQDEMSIEQPSLDSGKELNLGLLSGGFRNKAKTPYTKTPSDVTSPPSDEVPVNDALVSSNRTFQRVSGLPPSKRTLRNSSPKFQASHYDIEDESHSDEQLPPTSIKHGPDRCIQNVSSVSSHKSSFNSRSTYSQSNKYLNEEGTTEQTSPSKPLIGSSSVDSHKSSVSSIPTYPDNDNLQNQEETTVKNSHPKPHLGSGLSRRTKTSTPDGQRKSSRETYGPASLSVMELQATELEEQFEVPKLKRPIPRKSVPEVKGRPNKPSSSNEQLKSSSNDSLKPNTGTASSSNLKTDQGATKQDSSKKASHVHPKLPDFDTLAAHFSSLRKDSK